MDVQSPIHSATVILSGTLDQYKAEPLKERMLEAIASAAAQSTNILVDLTTVEHIDASCLQVLLTCNSMQAQNKLKLTGATPAIRQWIRTAGADALFDFVDTTDSGGGS